MWIPEYRGPLRLGSAVHVLAVSGRLYVKWRVGSGSLMGIHQPLLPPPAGRQQQAPPHHPRLGSHYSHPPHSISSSCVFCLHTARPYCARRVGAGVVVLVLCTWVAGPWRMAAVVVLGGGGGAVVQCHFAGQHNKLLNYSWPPFLLTPSPLCPAGRGGGGAGGG